MPHYQFGFIINILTTTVLPLLTLIVLWHGLRIANRTLTRSVKPEVECFLRPRPHSHVFELAIANLGMGTAHNVSVELLFDENDFEGHKVFLTWRSTKVPFSVIEPGGSINSLFGAGHLLVGDGPPLKPFKAFVEYQWQPFWTKRLKCEKREFSLDVRPFMGMNYSIQSDETAEALRQGFRSVTQAIKHSSR